MTNDKLRAALVANLEKIETLPHEQGYPIAECELGERDPIWRLLRCPYCGKSHTHSRGEGLRVSHCCDPHVAILRQLINPSWPRSYYLRLA
jgi:hypothetical protein